MNHNCIKCGSPLIVGENITQYGVDHYQYICRSCTRDYSQKYAQEHCEHRRKRDREYTHRTGQCHSMDENRQCPQYLGVYVAERALSHVFEHVERMPYGNPGYDFICGGGYRIDVKSSCRRVSEKQANRWMFNIKKNKIAEYFLCLAFDNRESLNPEHIWLIPAADVNDCITVSISEITLAKWDEYKLDIDKVSACCNIIRGG